MGLSRSYEREMDAEERLRYEITKCRRCEACKDLLDLSCVIFPEMFSLVDKEWETGEAITTDQLRRLVNLCNFCAACPCSDIRAALMDAKTEYMDRFGLGFRVRVLENVERLGRLGGRAPQFTNSLFKNGTTKTLITKIAGIHSDRRIPPFPQENFSEWLGKREKRVDPGRRKKRKVAYFAGCTARYFFPDVAKSVVEVFERNQIEVYCPEQKCCGMPPLLEGDRKLTLEFARDNVNRLAEAVTKGYDIVCSCPTCGYMLKEILKIGASQIIWHQGADETETDFAHVQVGHGIIGAISGLSSVRLPKKYLDLLLRDEGFFSSISPEKRILVSENSYDLGEYLHMLHGSDELDTRFGIVPLKAAYYPPCHLRKQKIGRPYQELMGLIPGVTVAPVNGDYCCGNAGVMGFKQEFHRLSIRIASRLIQKIRDLDPQVLLTDCLSCRIQFNQLTPYDVRHPIEIMKESYRNYQEEGEEKAVGAFS